MQVTVAPIEDKMKETQEDGIFTCKRRPIDVILRKFDYLELIEILRGERKT